jgi:hypothetical protein
MKSKLIIALISLLVVAILVVVLKSSSFRTNLSFDDVYQRQFIHDAGLLSTTEDTNGAIYYYAQAIRVLRDQGIDKENVKNITGMSFYESDSCNKIITLFIRGATLHKIGISSLEDSYETNIYNDELEPLDLLLLSQVIADVAKTDLTQKKHLDRALLIAKAHIAVGIQFSSCGRLLHTVGLYFKSQGLDLLERYLETCNDISLSKSIKKIRIEYEEECKQVRKQRLKERKLSFWDVLHFGQKLIEEGNVPSQK